MSYDDFSARRARLDALLAETGRLCDTLGAHSRAARLKAARENLSREVFRLMVVGEFKRGKSTLINALLGVDVLPSKVAPCTSVITEIREGAPGAVLFPVDGPPQPVPLSDLRRYVVSEADAEGAAPPWRRIDVSLASPLLAAGVELVDSPGLNEHRVRNVIALDYLPRSDALLVVLSCEQALSQSEASFLNEQLGAVSGEEGSPGVRHVFFVWNRFDAIADRPADVEAVRAVSRQWLEPRLGAPDRVHFVSARDALKGRLTGDAHRLERSGFLPFEAALERFLTTERGRVKLWGPQAACEQALRDLLDTLLPRREQLLHVPLDTLQKRLKIVEPQLQALSSQRQVTLSVVDRRAQLLSEELSAAYQDLVTRLNQGLPAVAATVDVSVFAVVTSSRRARLQVAEALEKWLSLEIKRWEQLTLRPLVDRHLEGLSTDLHHRLRIFLRDLDAVRDAIHPSIRVKVGEAGDAPDPVDRVLGAIGGFFLGGVGSAVEGAGLGFKTMLKGVGYHLGLGLGLLAMGAGLPVILGASLALGVARTLTGGQAAVERLRAGVIKAVAEGLLKTIPTVTADLSVRVEARFLELRGGLAQGMDVLLSEVTAEIRQILAERAEGERTLAVARAELEAHRRRVLALSAELSALSAEVEPR